LKAPFLPGREVPEHRLKVFVVNQSCQMLECVELVLMNARQMISFAWPSFKIVSGDGVVLGKNLESTLSAH
jgi:hypothetical protein